MFNDDSEPQRVKKSYLVGQDVSAFSLADLDVTMESLRAEILRLEAERKRKSASQAAADALFRKTE